MKTRFGWNLPNLSGWAVLLTYCGASASIGCAAPLWERTTHGPHASAAIQRHTESQVARSGGPGAVKPAQVAAFKANSVANSPAPAGPAMRGSYRGPATAASTRMVARGMSSRRGAVAAPTHEETVAAAHGNSPSVARRQASPSAVRSGAPAVNGRDHDRADSSYQAALTCWKNGDSDGAKRHLDDALAAHPRHRDANLLLAEWCLLADCPEEAAGRVAQLCRDRPHDARAFHTLGTLLAASGRDRDAIALYERAARLAPEDTMYQYAVDAASGRSQYTRPRDLLTGGSAPAASERASNATSLAAASSQPASIRLDGKASAEIKLHGEEPRRLSDVAAASQTPASSAVASDEHAEMFRVMTSPTARAAMLAGGSAAIRSRTKDRACSVCSNDEAGEATSTADVTSTADTPRRLSKAHPRPFVAEDAQPLVGDGAADAEGSEQSSQLRLRINSGEQGSRGAVRRAGGATASGDIDAQEPAATDEQPDSSSQLRLKANEHQAAGQHTSNNGETDGTVPANYRWLLSAAIEAYEADQPLKGRRLLEQAAQATAAASDRETAEVEVSVEAMKRAENQLAIELLKPASARADATVRIFRTLGTAYYRAGEFPHAAKALEQAVSLDSSSALSYFLLGSSLNKLGKQREAAGYMQRAALLDPRYGEGR